MSPTDEASAIMLMEADVTATRFPGFLDTLPPELYERVLSIALKREFKPGQPIFRHGDKHEGIHLITAGRVRSYYTAPSGREVTLAYWFPGNFVGAPDMFGGSLHMWTSSAEHRCSTLFLPGSQLRQLATESNVLSLALIDALAFKARCYSAMAQMLGTRSASERLRHLLVFLATTYGVAEEDGTVIAANFTQSELASLIGSTRQWITVQLKALQDAGTITYARGAIVVRDLKGLQAGTH